MALNLHSLKAHNEQAHVFVFARKGIGAGETSHGPGDTRLVDVVATENGSGVEIAELGTQHAVVVQLHSDLYFAKTSAFISIVERLSEKLQVEVLIVDCGNVKQVDGSGVKALSGRFHPTINLSASM